MSKTSQKKIRSRKRTKTLKQKTTLPLKQPPAKQHSKKKYVAFAIITILVAIPFSMGKYIEFNSPDPYDSGAYVYSAKHILDGAEIGVDEVPSAKLGTLLVNMLGVWMFGFSETGPKFMQMLFQAAALVLMFIAMRKLFGILPATVGVIIASVYLSSPLIAKFGNVKEQHMIAFMVMGVSCFVLRQLDGKWWWAVLAGAFLSWAPMFKETGTSAIGAVGLFVIVQPLLKHRSWKKTAADILLLLAGAVAAIGPLYVWIIGWDIHTALPYSFVWNTLGKMLPKSGSGGQAKAAADYVAGGRKLVPFSQQWPRVLRFYLRLILPITLAVCSIIARLAKMVSASLSKPKNDTKTTYGRFVLLFAVWWLLDMAYVWISPRSYDQYYLPLNASAAMLGGYLIAIYCGKVKSTAYKTRWVLTGLVGFLLMIIMSWHIFFGIETSPHTGRKYPRKRYGYSQKWNEISSRRKNNLKMPWEVLAEYIRNNSKPTDKIYVWGWYPGIYLSAQRFSPVSHACMLPRKKPQRLANVIAELLADFEREPPKFIVDSRKLHIPTERPPYELWPIVLRDFMGVKKGNFLPLDERIIAQYDAQWSAWLRKNFGEDEALRYEVLKPFRESVMKNYKIVRPFGTHILFQRK